MEDIVAVEATTDAGSCYVVTWGRIQDPVDPGPLESLVLRLSPAFALPGTGCRCYTRNPPADDPSMGLLSYEPVAPPSPACANVT